MGKLMGLPGSEETKKEGEINDKENERMVEYIA